MLSHVDVPNGGPRRERGSTTSRRAGRTSPRVTTATRECSARRSPLSCSRCASSGWNDATAHTPASTSTADASDPFPLELETDDPNAANVTREFDTFDEAAEENAFSRIFLGVHRRVDGVDGLATGRGVANQVSGSALRGNKTCAGWTCFDYDLPVL